MIHRFSFSSLCSFSRSLKPQQMPHVSLWENQEKKIRALLRIDKISLRSGIECIYSLHKQAVGSLSRWLMVGIFCIQTLQPEFYLKHKKKFFFAAELEP